MVHISSLIMSWLILLPFAMNSGVYKMEGITNVFPNLHYSYFQSGLFASNTYNTYRFPKSVFLIMHDTSPIVWYSIWSNTCHFPILWMRRFSDVFPINCHIIITVGSHLSMTNSKGMEKLVQNNPSVLQVMVDHVVIFLPITQNGATWGSFYVFNQSKWFVRISVWSENIDVEDYLLP